MRRLVLILFVLLSPLPGLAASYYVDFTGGADTNNGTATGTAFQHCPGDTNATDTAASTTLSAGDTVYFKGGVQYNGTVTLGWSGSSNASRIVYDGNTSGGWGTGKAIIDGEDTRYLGFNSTTARNYITIRGFEIRNLANKTSGTCYADQGGIYVVPSSGTSTGLLFDNNYIHDSGYWNNDCGNTTATAIGGMGAPCGVGIRTYLTDNLVVSNNEITKTGHFGVGAWSSINGTFSGNNIHDYLVWGIEIAGGSVQPNNNTISGNRIYNLYHHDAGIRTTVSGCDAHTDFVFIRQGSPTDDHPINTVIEKNLFYNDNTFTNFGGTAMIFMSFADNTTIRNNVFINPHSYYTSWDGSYTTYGTKYHNNTIYSPRSGTTAIGFTGDLTGPTEIYNNIAIGGIWAIDLAGASWQTYLTSDNNVFVGSIHQGDNSFGAWQALGFDDNSISTTVAAIKFVDISGYPASSSTMNLSLQADSPAIDNGTDLSATFTTDYTGATRTGTFDIGAYEYYFGTDTTPSAFSFTDQTGVALGSTNNSDNVTTAGFDNQTTLALTGDASCKYSINGAAWATANDNITVGDNVALQNVASGAYSTPISCTLNLGGVTDTWSRTTLAASAAAVPQRFRGGSMGGRK